MITKINKFALCVLKFASNSNLLKVDYVPMEKDNLQKDFEIVRKKLKNPKYNPIKSILDNIKEENNPLFILLESYPNYCKELNKPYQGIEFFDENNLTGFGKEELNVELLKDLEDRMLAYLIEKTYEICEEYIANKELLAYSHKITGWHSKQFSLSNIFSINFETNFGFGNSSYFFLILTYKDINIIPFSQWVSYQYANVSDIIRYSASYEPYDGSWLEAMKYAAEVYNLSIVDEKNFISKYIISECENMVIGLEQILDDEANKISDGEPIQIRLNSKGKISYKFQNLRQLAAFRGEKISGALEFIESINKFKNIMSIENFILRIEECNKTIQPILKREIPLLEAELDDLNKRLKELRLKNVTLQPLYDKHLQQIESYKAEIIKDKGNPYNLNLSNLKFKKEYSKLPTIIELLQTKYPKLCNEFKELKEEYDFLKKEYDKIELEKQNTEKLKNQFTKYNTEINKYFKEKTSK